MAADPAELFLRRPDEICPDGAARPATARCLKPIARLHARILARRLPTLFQAARPASRAKCDGSRAVMAAELVIG